MLLPIFDLKLKCCFEHVPLNCYSMREIRRRGLLEKQHENFISAMRIESEQLRHFSIKCVTRNFLLVVVQNNSREIKCTRKCGARAKLFFVANYSIDFLRFSLLSPLSIVRFYFLFR